MSNVLCPIVTRYSLFFTLALSDSSRLARSKHPRQVVHELVLSAQERFQARHHADATLKLRAVIRNVSTASACSTKTSSTANSSLCSGTLTLSTSSSSPPSSSYSSTLAPSCQAISAISTETSLSASTAQHCPSAAAVADAPCDRCMSSLPPMDGKSAVVSTCASATFALSTIGPHHHAAIALSAAPTLDTSEEHHLLSVDPSSAVLAHSCTASPSSLDSSASLSLSSTFLLSSLNPPCSAVHSSQTTSKISSSSSNRSSRGNSRPTSLSRASRRPKATLIHPIRPAPLSSHSRTFSIATLLSISLTVIFLSLMQSRRKHLRRRSRPSQQKPLSRRRNLIDPSNSSAPPSPSSPQRSSAYKDSESDYPLSSHYHDELLSTAAHSAPSPSSSPQHHSVTMPSTTGHRRDPRLLKQTREEYVSAWLSQQEGCTDSALEPMEEEPRDDSNSMEDMTHLQHNLVDSSQHPVPTRGRPMPSAHTQLYPPPPLPPHSACPSTVVRGRGSAHRRSVSLVHPNHAPAPWPQQPQHYFHPGQMHQRHHSTDRARHASPQHHGYYPAHPVVPHHASKAQQHYRTTSVQEPVESFERWTATRTANELAWERHNYYQRLQQEEEQLAKKMRREQLQRQSRQQLRQPNQARAVRQVQRQDSSVARTGSLNRLASPSQLSAETSRILGLCRSNTLSAAVKRISLSAKKDPSSRSATPAHSTVHAEDIIVIVTPEADDESAPAVAAVPGNSHPPNVSTSSTSSSSHAPRKSLKDHLAPPLRSLARRCSSRFSSGCSSHSHSSRPNSVVGSSARDSAADRALRRRSTGSAPASTVSDHMYDFKPLQAGPETMEIQKQREEREALIRSVLSEKVPVHRTVSLFRSRTHHHHHPPHQRTPLSPGSMGMGEGEHSITMNGAETVPTRSMRRSLRFANGRGLDFSTFVDPRGEKTESNDRSRASDDVKKHTGLNGQGTDLTSYPLRSSASTSTSLSSLLETMSDMDEHESMRREILAILALGRKGTRRGAIVSAASGSGDSHAKTAATATPAAMTTTTTTTTTVTVSRPGAPTTTASTAHRLSPLAVEAQEHIPVQVEDDDDDENDDDEVLKMTATGTKAMRMEEGAEMIDPCEHIAFMLVPKSRYEFQPLIV
ncbi:unnamed protein product [Mortierella alpina]